MEAPYEGGQGRSAIDEWMDGFIQKKLNDTKYFTVGGSQWRRQGPFRINGTGGPEHEE